LFNAYERFILEDATTFIDVSVKHFIYNVMYFLMKLHIPQQQQQIKCTAKLDCIQQDVSVEHLVEGVNKSVKLWLFLLKGP